MLDQISILFLFRYSFCRNGRNLFIARYVERVCVQILDNGLDYGDFHLAGNSAYALNVRFVFRLGTFRDLGELIEHRRVDYGRTRAPDTSGFAQSRR